MQSHMGNLGRWGVTHTLTYQKYPLHRDPPSPEITDFLKVFASIFVNIAAFGGIMAAVV